MPSPYPTRAHRQREKTLPLFCPFCGAKMTDVSYDGTGNGWERSTELPRLCPRLHSLSSDLRFELANALDERAIAGVGDDDPRDV